MPALTKVRLTKNREGVSMPKVDTKQNMESDFIPWREVFKEEITKYGEQALALRGARFREGMTQMKLSELTGISQRHISEMENGKRSIGKVIAKRLAKVFQTDYRLFL